MRLVRLCGFLLFTHYTRAVQYGVRTWYTPGYTITVVAGNKS